MQNLSHQAVLIHEQAKTYGDREALIYKDFGGAERLRVGERSSGMREYYRRSQRYEKSPISITETGDYCFKDKNYF